MGSATQVPAPVHRRLRVYAFDPYLATRLETAEINSLTMNVPWESEDGSGKSSLKPGPVGEYVEVIDLDPASECFYAPVDLDDPAIVAQDGLAPSEGNPQFHQQMVYAVVMNTIRSFERALGRCALWAPDWADADGKWHYGCVPRLRVYPHALRDANAYYSREKRALLLGYFPASEAVAGVYLPGGMVFTCLSHDIVAHETCHALVDGVHPRFLEPSNPDVLAFHEAFADVVALLQHFSFPEVLRDQVRKTQGDLARQSLLGELAQEFGRAIGRYGALRGALGETDEKGVWQRRQPDPGALERTLECHERGSLLVAAIFDAFVGIYTRRAADLLRIAAGGTAARPRGELHPDLVNRLAEEAAKSARHLLTICIRALDYCPPVDITFGDYLRALITADYEAVRDDDRGYRLAVIDAFRSHGIYPRNVRTLSEESLRWSAPTGLSLARQGESGILAQLAKFARECRDLPDRCRVYEEARRCAVTLHQWFVDHADEITPEQEKEMGLCLAEAVQAGGPTEARTDRPFEVHSVRPLMRISPDGDAKPEVVVEITQQLKTEDPEAPFRGGCTLLLDAETGAVRYCINKDIQNKGRLNRQRDYQQGWHFRALAATARERTGRKLTDEPFALLPAKAEEG